MEQIDEDTDVEYEPEIFQISSYTVTLTTISFMPIEKLLENQSRGVEISGQKLWCGSLVIIEYLLNHKEIVQGSLVIELGSGTGLLGMICSILGSSIVYLTDHDRKSLQHMTKDIATNNLTHCEVLNLDWCKSDYTSIAIQDVLNRFHSNQNSQNNGNEQHFINRHSFSLSLRR